MDFHNLDRQNFTLFFPILPLSTNFRGDFCAISKTEALSFKLSFQTLE